MNEISSKIELTAVFQGVVQGVGFRRTVSRHAENYNLVGIIKNLSDGTVKVHLQGPKEKLLAFLAAVQERPGHATIVALDCEYHCIATHYKGLSVE